MSQIPTNRGNPQFSELALQDALPFTGTLSREDGQTVMDTIDGDTQRLHEDRNILLSRGGLITFTGTQVQFTEALRLELNTTSTGTPVIIDLGSTTRSVTNNGDMIYATINRTSGTAVITDGATSLPTSTSNKEIFLIAKRIDDAGGKQRLYWRNGTSIDAGQVISLGVGSQATYAKIFLNM